MFCRSQEGNDWTSPKQLRVQDPGMMYSSLTSHPTTGDTGLDDCLGITEPEVANVLPFDVKHAEEVDFERTNVIALFKKGNDQVRMCVGIMSNIFFRYRC